MLRLWYLTRGMKRVNETADPLPWPQHISFFMYSKASPSPAWNQDICLWWNLSTPIQPEAPPEPAEPPGLSFEPSMHHPAGDIQSTASPFYTLLHLCEVPHRTLFTLHQQLSLFCFPNILTFMFGLNDWNTFKIIPHVGLILTM